MWSCGYDDHALPPVRGGGNQGFHTAVPLGGDVGAGRAAATARRPAQGQLIDVNMHAASNVTTEMATYGWLVGRRRGAAPDRPPRRAASSRQPTQVRCRDGRYANTGVPPRDAGRVRQACSTCSTASACATSSRSRPSWSWAPSASAINFADIEVDPMVAEIFDRRPRRRCGSSPSTSTPTTSSSRRSASASPPA